MNNFVIDTPDNFWQIRWLDKYMEGHKGFIAGGCFKNILSGEKVKDIDIFFESESDFQEAVDLFNDKKHQKEGWKFKYRNEKVCAFQKEGEKVWVEFIESEFGKPEEILRSFDFTVTKIAYYKEPKYEEKEGDYFPFSFTDIVGYEYKLLYHDKFFEHLHMKGLVIDENIPFPGRYIQVNQEPCNTHVDWEQRRYEMAKTMLPITSVSGRGPHGELILETCDKAAELAVIYADTLIKELKINSICSS